MLWDHNDSCDPWGRGPAVFTLTAPALSTAFGTTRTFRKHSGVNERGTRGRRVASARTSKGRAPDGLQAAGRAQAPDPSSASFWMTGEQRVTSLTFSFLSRKLENGSLDGCSAPGNR